MTRQKEQFQAEMNAAIKASDDAARKRKPEA
jgi:hypothetical protein